MSVFEVTIALFSINARQNIQSGIMRAVPDLSAERAKIDILLFMPGVTASLLLFLVFGTTVPFLKYMRTCFRRQDPRHTCISPDMSPLRSLPSRDGDKDDGNVPRPLEARKSLCPSFFQCRGAEVPEKKPGVWVYRGTPPAAMMDAAPIPISRFCTSRVKTGSSKASWV